MDRQSGRHTGQQPLCWLPGASATKSGTRPPIMREAASAGRRLSLRMRKGRLTDGWWTLIEPLVPAHAQTGLPRPTIARRLRAADPCSGAAAAGRTCRADPARPPGSRHGARHCLCGSPWRTPQGPARASGLPLRRRGHPRRAGTPPLSRHPCRGSLVPHNRSVDAAFTDGYARGSPWGGCWRRGDATAPAFAGGSTMGADTGGGRAPALPRRTPRCRERSPVRRVRSGPGGAAAQRRRPGQPGLRLRAAAGRGHLAAVSHPQRRACGRRARDIARIEDDARDRARASARSVSPIGDGTQRRPGWPCWRSWHSSSSTRRSGSGCRWRPARRSGWHRRTGRVWLRPGCAVRRCWRVSSGCSARVMRL